MNGQMAQWVKQTTLLHHLQTPSKIHLTNISDEYLAGLLSGHYVPQHCDKSLWLNFCIQTPLYNLHAMLTVTHYAKAIIRKSRWHIHPVIRSVYCYCIVITF